VSIVRGTEIQFSKRAFPSKQLLPVYVGIERESGQTSDVSISPSLARGAGTHYRYIFGSKARCDRRTP
jgi:hypothetical protein